MIEISGKFCKDLKIFTDNVEESALQLLYNIADCPIYEGKRIRIMPDVHTGKGITIGFSCPIDIEKDMVNPSYIGSDIGCTISATFFDKPIPIDKIAEFEHKIKKEIPFGMEINDKSKIDAKTIIKRFNRAQNRLISRFPLFSEFAIEMNNEKDLENWCKHVHIDYGIFLKSIGTVGGGEA